MCCRELLFGSRAHALDLGFGQKPVGGWCQKKQVAVPRAHAFVENHSGVYPDDVQAVFTAIAGHRLKPAGGTRFRSPSETCQHVLDSVAIP